MLRRGSARRERGWRGVRTAVTTRALVDICVEVPWFVAVVSVMMMVVVRLELVLLLRVLPQLADLLVEVTHYASTRLVALRCGGKRNNLSECE